MMRHLSTATLLLLALLLAGCEIVLTGGISQPSDLTIRNAGYLTDAKAEIDGVDQYVICDDRISDLTYFFEYEGELDAWASYLEGKTTGDIVGYRTFTPGSSGVQHTPNDVMVTYAIDPGVAPLAADAPMTSQGIVVVPAPEVIGYSRLYLEIASSGSVRELTSRDIPVLSNCVG